MVSNEDNLQWKTTSKYRKWNISATTGWIVLKFETLANGIRSVCTKVSNEDDLQGRQPQNYKKWNISKPNYQIRSFNLSSLVCVPKTRTHILKGAFIGNPKGNLECGSAQPSLFDLTFASDNCWSKGFCLSCHSFVRVELLCLFSRSSKVH